MCSPLPHVISRNENPTFQEVRNAFLKCIQSKSKPYNPRCYCSLLRAKIDPLPKMHLLGSVLMQDPNPKVFVATACISNKPNLNGQVELRTWMKTYWGPMVGERDPCNDS